MLQLLTYFNRNEYVELERLRIWDFYLLFPDKVHSIKLRRDEDDIKQLRQSFIIKQNNPYENVMDDRKMFEKIKSYQITAIKCLASYGIINKEFLSENRVTIISKAVLEKYMTKFEPLSIKEQNVIKLMTSHFYFMTMFGPMGLKDRTHLLETRYDAQ
ncbi:MAG TPA: ABC-three component system middle component 5 [Sphingobacteriaceae bacterium]